MAINVNKDKLAKEVKFNANDVKCIKYLSESDESGTNPYTVWSKPITVAIDSLAYSHIALNRNKTYNSDPVSEDTTILFTYTSTAGALSSAYAFDMLSGSIKDDDEIGYVYSNPNVEYRLYKDSTPLTDYKKISLSSNNSFSYYTNSNEYNYNKIGFKATFDREYDTKQINLRFNPSISSDYIDGMYITVKETTPSGTVNSHIYTQNTSIIVNYGNKYNISAFLGIKFPQFTFRDPEAGIPPNPNLEITNTRGHNTSASITLNSIMEIYNCNTITLESVKPSGEIEFTPNIHWISGDSRDVQYIFNITDENWRLTRAEDYAYTPISVYTQTNSAFIFFSNLRSPSIYRYSEFYFWCETSLNTDVKITEE